MCSYRFGMSTGGSGNSYLTSFDWNLSKQTLNLKNVYVFINICVFLDCQTRKVKATFITANIFLNVFSTIHSFILIVVQKNLYGIPIHAQIFV